MISSRTRIFDGKKYYFDCSFRNTKRGEKGAKLWATRRRDRGCLVRVVKSTSNLNVFIKCKAGELTRI